jgi:hypothetical protein
MSGRIFLEKAALLIKRYDKLLNKHPGKWVAIDHDKVIATSKNVDELTKRIKHKNDVLIAYSPTLSEKKVGCLLS